MTKLEGIFIRHYKAIKTGNKTWEEALEKSRWDEFKKEAAIIELKRMERRKDWQLATVHGGVETIDNGVRTISATPDRRWVTRQARSEDGTA